MTKLPDDICEKRHKLSPTSIEANKRVNKILEREKVLDVFRIFGESWLKQVMRIVNKPANEVSPRISELLALGILEDTGRREEGCRILKLKR